MIVCHCNVISARDIARVVEDLLREDEWRLITVGMVYHALAKRGQCCGCFPNAIGVIVDTVEAWHRAQQRTDDVVVPLIARIRDEHLRFERARDLRTRAA